MHKYKIILQTSSYIIACCIVFLWGKVHIRVAFLFYLRSGNDKKSDWFVAPIGFLREKGFLMVDDILLGKSSYSRNVIYQTRRKGVVKNISAHIRFVPLYLSIIYKVDASFARGYVHPDKGLPSVRIQHSAISVHF